MAVLQLSVGDCRPYLTFLSQREVLPRELVETNNREGGGQAFLAYHKQPREHLGLGTMWIDC